jgi:hypothetical protein
MSDEKTDSYESADRRFCALQIEGKRRAAEGGGRRAAVLLLVRFIGSRVGTSVNVDPKQTFGEPWNTHPPDAK